MRVLYVAPRYHTNQIPVMEGWLERGDEVLFISQFAGTPEDYTVLSPVVLGYSALFEIQAKCYRFFFCRKEKSLKKEYDFRIKAGFPPIGAAGKYISTFKPDIVIVRERAIYNIPFTQKCRRNRIPCVLYNQSPLWDVPDRDRGIAKRLFLPFLPKIRITPVIGEKSADKVMTPDTVFVPFVVKPHFSSKQKEHFAGGRINIICVARYEARKNLFMLVDVFHVLAQKYPICLTIIGEYKNEGQKEYYNELEKRISEYDLERRVSLLKNLCMEQMYAEYRKADLFVLPSTKERASVSQLEAMSCSLPVICSNTNGSACYIEDGRNGYLFRDSDADDLKDKLEQMLADRGRMIEMGREGYRLVTEQYQFMNYYDKIRTILMSLKPDGGDS